MILNKDLTKESVEIFVTNTQIYARIFSKSHGKWTLEEYFKAYDFEIDEELINSTINYIKRLWKLHNPQIIITK